MTNTGVKRLNQQMDSQSSKFTNIQNERSNTCSEKDSSHEASQENRCRQESLPANLNSDLSQKEKFLKTKIDSNSNVIKMGSLQETYRTEETLKCQFESSESLEKGLMSDLGNNAGLNLDNLEIQDFNVEGLKLTDLTDDNTDEKLRNMSENSKLGISQLQQIELSNKKMVNAFLGSGMDNTSDQLQSRNSQFLGVSNTKYRRTLKNISEVGEGEDSSQQESNELSKQYLKTKMKEINRRMTQTDFKGNLIEGLSEPSTDPVSEISFSTINNKIESQSKFMTNAKKNMEEKIPEKQLDLNFGDLSKNLKLGDLSKSPPNKINMKGPVPSYEQSQFIVEPFPPEKPIIKRGIRNKSDLARQTFIPFQKLKPLKTDLNLNSKMNKHRKAILQMTNQQRSSDGESLYSENETDLFSEDQDLEISHDVSQLNRAIRNQLNPHKNIRKSSNFIPRRNNQPSDFTHRFRNNTEYAVGDIKPMEQIEEDTDINPFLQPQNNNPNRDWNTRMSGRVMSQQVSLCSSYKGFRSTQFKDLAFVCEKNVKFLKIIQIDNEFIHLVSKKSLSAFLMIPITNIKMLIASEKDKFLIRIHYKGEKQQSKLITLELPGRNKLLNFFKRRNMDHCILTRKSLDIEGDDNFKNCSLNIFPNSPKQGFLELFVDDFFHDWKTFFVTVVDKCLFLFPVHRKQDYKKYKEILRKVKVYRIISYNLVGKPSKIGLNRKYTFVVKIKNESSQLIFSAYNRVERKQWLNVL